MNIEPISIEDAFNYIIQFIREGKTSSYGSYGYGVYLPNVMRKYIAEKYNNGREEDYIKELAYISPNFYSAAWNLCRRGILRPGVQRYGKQETRDGSAGNGYSITPFGEIWIQESDKDNYVPTEPERLGEMLEKMGEHFGPGFQQRAQEAIRCYGAHSYLACCVMCGAAAESIILALSIKKTKDEEFVLKGYSRASGRQNIENIIIGKKKEHLQREFRGYTNLLKYWRDNSAHGRAVDIQDNEAFTSIAVLLRFCHFANDNWDELIVE